MAQVLIVGKDVKNWAHTTIAGFLALKYSPSGQMLYNKSPSSQAMLMAYIFLQNFYF